jgi:hypothetical protein
MEDKTQDGAASGGTTDVGAQHSVDTQHSNVASGAVKPSAESSAPSSGWPTQGSHESGEAPPNFNLLQQGRDDSPSIPTSILTNAVLCPGSSGYLKTFILFGFG